MLVGCVDPNTIDVLGVAGSVYGGAGLMYRRRFRTPLRKLGLEGANDCRAWDDARKYRRAYERWLETRLRKKRRMRLCGLGRHVKCTGTWLLALINPVSEYGSPGLSSQKICKASSVISEYSISLRMVSAACPTEAR